MSAEINTKLADAKDFAQQVKLEASIKGREVKHGGLQKLAEKIIPPYHPDASDAKTGAKMMSKDTLHTVEDRAEQVGLELKIRSRDAKLALDKTPAKQKLDEVAIATKDALVDAKDAIVDAVHPATEGDASAHIQKQQAKTELREARDQEREQERKRQELLDTTKAKVSSAAATTGAVLSQVANKAEVVLGKAALGLKDKLDEYSDDKPRSEVTPGVSASGVDITSVQNTRNEELAAKDARDREIAKAQEKPLLEKAKEAISNTAASIKESYVAATTDAPAPLYVPKTSSHGVDISHIENAANAEIAQREQEQLEQAKLERTKREKAVVEGQLKQEIGKPLEAKKDDVQSSLEEKKEGLSSTLAALGDSLLKASQKLGETITHKYNEIAHDVREKTDDASTKSDSEHLTLTQTEAAPKKVDIHANESVKDTVIRKTLDAGVALSEASSSASVKATHLKNEAQYKGKIAAAEADIKKQDLEQKAAIATTKANLKAQELVDTASIKATQLKNDVKLATADLSAKATELSHKASEKVQELKESAKTKLGGSTDVEDEQPKQTLKQKAEIASTKVNLKAHELADSASIKATELKNDAKLATANLSAKASELSHKTSEKVEELKDSAKTKLSSDAGASQEKSEASIQKQDLEQKAAVATTKANLKAQELADSASIKATELKSDIKVATADLSAKATQLGHKASDKMEELKDSAKTKLSGDAGVSHEKPELIRKYAVDELPIMSPITPTYTVPLNVANVEKFEQ